MRALQKAKEFKASLAAKFQQAVARDTSVRPSELDAPLIRAHVPFDEVRLAQPDSVSP